MPIMTELITHTKKKRIDNSNFNERTQFKRKKKFSPSFIFSIMNLDSLCTKHDVSDLPLHNIMQCYQGHGWKLGLIFIKARFSNIEKAGA